MVVERHIGLPTAPTSLELFCYPPARREVLLQSAKVAGQIRSSFVRSREAMTELGNRTIERLERLQEIGNELVLQNNEVWGAIECSRVYLKMEEELRSMGATPEEVFNFYCFCYKTSQRYFDVIEQRNIGRDNLLHQKVRENLCKEVVDKALDSFGPPPSWFAGNKTEWRAFCEIRFSFRSYVEGDRRGSVMIKVYNPPDWFNPESKQPPDSKEVELELQEDMASAESFAEMAKEINKQMIALDDGFRKKSTKAMEKEDEWLHKIPGIVQDMPTFLLYMNAIVPMMQTMAKGISKDRVRRSNRRQALDAYLDPENYYINVFSQDRQLLASPEVGVLWLEAKLKEAGVIGAASDLIDDRFLDIWEKVVGKELDSAWWDNLRKENKNMFSVLYHEIRASLLLSTPEDREYLIEFAKESKGRPVGGLIWAVPDVYLSIPESNPNWDEIDVKRYESVTSKVPVFVRKWLKSNWKWALEELSRRIKGNGLLSERPSGPEADLPESINELIASTTDIEEEAGKLSRGILDGWNMIYILNAKQPANPKYQRDLNSLSEDDKEKMLSGFMVSEGIPHANRASRIIKVLEGVVVAPPDADSKHLVYRAWGNTYFKIKKDDMRICYTLDRTAKTLKFFVEHRGNRSYYRAPRN